MQTFSEEITNHSDEEMWPVLNIRIIVYCVAIH